MDHSPKALKTEGHFDSQFPKNEVVPVVFKRRKSGRAGRNLISSYVREAGEFVGIVFVALTERPVLAFGGDLAPEAIIAFGGELCLCSDSNRLVV